MSTELAPSFIDSRDVSRAALHDDDFERLVAEYGLDEVRIALAGLRDALASQFVTDPRDTPWRRRAGHLQARVDARLRETKTLIAARNRSETATVAAIERKWSAFAERLGRELYLRDPSVMQRMEGPNSDIDAAGWILARVEQRARKALNRSTPAEDAFGITHGATVEQAVGLAASLIQTTVEAEATVRRLEGVIEQKAIEETK